MTLNPKLLNTAFGALFDNLDLLCFPLQKEYIINQNKIRFRASCCSRRAGKTNTAVIALLRLCLSKKSRCYYVSDTKTHAVDLIWDLLKNYVSNFCLPGIRFREDEHQVHFDNGSRIYLFGAETEADFGKMRGNACDLVIIDEAQNIKYLREAIGAVTAATTDREGSIWLFGTPNDIRRGTWFDIIHNTNTTQTDQDPVGSRTLTGRFKVFNWTIKENYKFLDGLFELKDSAYKNKFLQKYPKGTPQHYKKLGEVILEDIAKKQYNGDRDNEEFRRDFLGEWVSSYRPKIFDFDGVRNTYEVLPEGEMMTFIGIDIGGGTGNKKNSSDAIAVLGVLGDTIYLLEEDTQDNSDVIDQGENIVKFRDKYQPIRMCADRGGGAVKAVMTWKNKFGLNIYTAIKGGSKDKEYNKRGNINLLNSFMKKGQIKVKTDARIINEWTTLIWNEKASPTDRDVYARHIKSDLADAFLYAFMDIVPNFIELRKEGTNNIVAYNKRKNMSPEEIKVERLDKEMREQIAGKAIWGPGFKLINRGRLDWI